MIYCLTGQIIKKNLDTLVISCGGVGYLVQTPASVAGGLPGVGSQTTVYTYMNITENNDVNLYAFANEEQLNCFKMLIGVSGVGPKAGLAILSALTPERAALAISAGDHKTFTAANGVGPKLAQRIVLELKDKVGKGLVDGVSLGSVAGVSGTITSSVGQATAALVALGYSQTDAAMAVARVDENLPVQEIIKIALRQLSQNRR